MPQVCRPCVAPRGPPSGLAYCGALNRSIIETMLTEPAKKPVRKRCGTCELLVRSSSPGLHTFGKCPHRYAWVRTHHDACEHHLAARRSRLVRAVVIVNVCMATLGLGSFVIYDILRGNLVSHVIVGAVALTVPVFFWFVRRFDMFSEDAKFQLLDEEDPPPAGHDDWLDRR